MTANQMLEMIVEQSVQELEKIENLKELHKHEDKFTFEEFEQLGVQTAKRKKTTLSKFQHKNEYF